MSHVNTLQLARYASGAKIETVHQAIVGVGVMQMMDGLLHALVSPHALTVYDNTPDNPEVSRFVCAAPKTYRIRCSSHAVAMRLGSAFQRKSSFASFSVGEELNTPRSYTHYVEQENITPQQADLIAKEITA